METIHSYTISRLTHKLLTILSLSVVVSFAVWWFSQGNVPMNFTGQKHILDIILFILVSYVIWHPILMEILTWSISWHIKDIRQHNPSEGLRVAFITTIVPSKESLTLLHNCLPAMVNADYPHDTWLLDEGNSPEVRKICEQYGVKHFSRFRRRLLNTTRGKFAKKTKGGNHNSWYEQYGNDYDVVAQIDTDFVPKSSFLTKTLGYFKDPEIAFVGTPQEYGNSSDSIIARGAGEQLFSFYGSILRGLSGMESTLLIGANHVIRVAALKDVNHYSAHITEDLLTGMKLHKRGWKSVYVPEVLAVGEGPFTWESYFAQQMRWAYGCMDILFFHSPRLFATMGLRRTIYYFFLQQHYFSGLAMGISLFLLSLYFATGVQAANVNNVLFFGFYSLILLQSWLTSVWLQRFNVTKEKDELQLYGKMISIAAWPIYFMAFICAIVRKRITYKVTPKGETEGNDKTNLRVFLPHFVFAFISAAGLVSSFFTGRQSSVMMLWALSSTILMLGVPFMHKIVKVLASFKLLLMKVVIYLRNQNIREETPLIEEVPTEFSKKNIITDVLFLTGVVVSSVVLYVQKIGFYSDDWSFIGNFSLALDKSIWGLFIAASTPNTFMRPVQNFYDAALYFAFGTNPLGYHIVNATVLLGICLLFYGILKQLNVPRIIAVAAPLTYILLPNYSVDRFWYAVFQANLSIFLYALSLFAALIAIDSCTRKTLRFKFISIIALILSGLSYEVVLPLYLITILILWYPREIISNKLAQIPVFKKPDFVFIALLFISLIYVLLFKAYTTTRLGSIDLLTFPFTMMREAFRVNYGTYGIQLPYIWGEMIARYWNQTILIGAVILYFVIFHYLWSIIAGQSAKYPTASWFRNIFIVSIIVFILGYAIFFTNSQVGFSPTGVENRVAIAASIGVAFSFIGFFGYFLRILLPKYVAKVLFCIIIALISVGGFVIINTVALFWGRAYEQGQHVLTAIHEKYPTLPKESILIVDGICPNIGPAPTFEASWDLKGALHSMYGDKTLQADVVTPRLEIKADAIYSQIYTFRTKYPYRKLLIYNYITNKSHTITNITEAQEYFAKYNPDLNNNCPVNRVGHGTDVL